MFPRQNKQNFVTKVIITRNICSLRIYDELFQIDETNRTVAERNATESRHVIN